MSVSYDTRVIYGFKIDTEKLIKFFKEKKERNEKFNEFEWLDRVREDNNCEFFLSDLWSNLEYCEIFFGISYENRLNPSLMVELEADRRQEVCDEFIGTFGTYDFLDRDTHYAPGCPEFIVFTEVR